MAEQPVTGPDNSAANRRRVAPVANRTPRVYRSLGFSPARRVVPHRMKIQRLAERSGAKLPAGVPCPARHICTYFILGSSQGNHSKTDEAFGCELPSPGTDIALPEHRHAALSVKYYTMIARSAYNKTVYNRGFAWNNVLSGLGNLRFPPSPWGYYTMKAKPEWYNRPLGRERTA